MSRELFGTDGVRGVAGEYPLNEEGAQRIGRAVGQHFAKPGQQIVIGCDTRESSAMLVAALTAGLKDMGVNVVSAGVLPTPGLAYITREHDEFVAGIMVTASHNPYQYNGVKVFDAKGGKLPDNTEGILNRLIDEGVQPIGSGSFSQRPELLQQYEDFLVSSTKGLQLQGMSIAVDAANGSASGIAERVLSRLGTKVLPLFDRPNGRNINQECGATDTKALQASVLENKLDLGIALDGDADRVIMVDNQGREVKGDYLLYILAVTQGVHGVVATTMSNVGFENKLSEHGIRLVRTDVGDRYVLEGLLKTGYSIGGEEAGHIIMLDLLQTGDGMLAAVQTLKALFESGKTLAEWCDGVQLIPQALVNIPLANKALISKPEVQEFINEQQASLDGGRLLIRPSGTEPLARVMVEAPGAEIKAQQIASDLQEILKHVSEGSIV